jgi:hypothetical protein
MHHVFWTGIRLKIAICPLLMALPVGLAKVNKL